ncbi:MAG: damage-inducible protein DinB, partial [Acidobacteriota bacterium]|nr:damage-inducible protein DinB [Acidobacteriota bacterium]
MTISEMLLPEFDEEMKNTRKMLERIPEDKFDFKPHEKSMTMGRLASHLAELPDWASHTLQMDVLDMQPGQKPYLAKSHKELLENFDNQVAA